jgi:hypothetical protein
MESTLTGFGIRFSPDLYAEVWGAFEPDSLNLDRYLERVVAVAG